MKDRLIKEKLIHEKCDLCSLGPEWQGHPLKLQIDHKNGIPTDNRFHNLRLLCPNCHSQTSTFSGRNRQKTGKSNKCQACNSNCSKQSSLCKKCSDIKNGAKRRKCKRPSKTTLKKLVEQHGYCWVGRKYGVSDNAIRKWM